MASPPSHGSNSTSSLDELKSALMQEFENLTNPTVTEQTMWMCTNKELNIIGQLDYIKKNKDRHEDSANFSFTRTMTTMLHSLPDGWDGNDMELSDLNRVGISTLAKNPNIVLWGKYFLCRTITEASKIVAVETVVDDPVGKWGVRLALYNWSPDSYVGTTDFQEVLPLGVYLIVKNPWFKSTASGGLVVRCDNPAFVDMITPKEMENKFPGLNWKSTVPSTHFQHIPFWQKYTSDLEIFNISKTLGNKAFVTKRYTDAFRWYNVALKYSQDDGQKATLYCNLSATCVNYGCPKTGLFYAEEALKLGEKKSEKAIYRKAKALLELRNYEDAISFLEDTVMHDGHLGQMSDFQNLLKLAKHHKLKILKPDQLLAFIKPPSNPLDTSYLPEINSGSFVVSPVSGKGRGVVATQDIPAGTVLLSCKVFGHYSAKTSKSKLYFSNNIGSKTVHSKPGHDQIVAQIANKLVIEPSLGKVIYSLTAGKGLGFLTPDDPRTKSLDMKRLDRLVAINSFGTDDLETIEGRNQYSGVWILPSFFNHSCTEANVTWNVYEDYMILRTSKFVNQGEELLILYVTTTKPYEERLSCFIGHEFQCSCPLCILDSSEPSAIKVRRAKIMAKLKILKSEDYRCDPSKVGKALKKVKILQNLRESYNPCLLEDSIYTLGDALYGFWDFAKCADLLSMCINVAEEIGDRVQGFKLRINLIRCFIEIGDLDNLNKEIATLKKDAVILFGCLEACSVFGSLTMSDLKTKYNIDIYQQK